MYCNYYTLYRDSYCILYGEKVIYKTLWAIFLILTTVHYDNPVSQHHTHYVTKYSIYCYPHSILHLYHVYNIANYLRHPLPSLPRGWFVRKCFVLLLINSLVQSLIHITVEPSTIPLKSLCHVQNEI